MHRRRSWKLLGIITAAVTAAVLAPLGSTPQAHAYAPTGGVMYELGSQPCLKGRGNCAIYPKSTQLPSGRLVAAFELATVTPSTGGATGGVMPVYKSDDNGTSWQLLSRVGAPAALSSDPAVSRYTSNWTNPYLYVLPQDIGDLRAGTLLLATVVSGEDEYYRERKAADPNWVPNNDGDRRDLAIALYSSLDDGASWSFRNIITTGGWQGGSAGATGSNISRANTTRQIDPVWEPHLLVHQGRLVAYYSDENDYTGFNPTTGEPILAPDNQTGPDTAAQILAHRTWDGRASAPWSRATIDVPGSTFSFNGSQRIGGGRPGMTTVAPTTDGRFFMTFEYFGGGEHGRYKLSADPLAFRASGDPNGIAVNVLPTTPGSIPLVPSGSPVITALPDGRILFNTNNSGDIWVNDSGRGDGVWTQHRTTVGAGYSRTMQYDRETGRVVILQGVWGGPTAGSTIRYGEVDLGDSVGAYYQLVNRRTGQVLGTGGNTTDADIGNGGNPDIRSEAGGSSDTQLWHVLRETDGTVTLLNKSGGREASIWGGGAAVGQRIGQWVDNQAGGTWTLTPTVDGYYRFDATANRSLSLTAATAGVFATLQNQVNDGSQEWRLVARTTRPSPVSNVVNGLCLDGQFATGAGAEVRQWRCASGTNQSWSLRPAADGWSELVNAHSNLCLDDYQFNTTPGAEVRQWPCNGGTNQQWRAIPAGDGTSTLLNRHSNLCLNNIGSATANGSEVRLSTCNNQPSQQWRIG